MNLSEVIQKTMIRSSRSSTSRLLYKLCTYPKLLAPQPPCSSPTTTSAAAVLSHLRRFSSASRKDETQSMRNLIKIGNFGLLRGQSSTQTIVSFRSPFQVARFDGSTTSVPCFARAFSSKSNSKGQKTSESKKEISTVEDPFDAPTYNIPDKPLSFTEGASYSVVILAGLGIAAAAGYAVFKELIFEPKEYKVFGKALRRIQDDSQVRVRIGSPITGYGQESRNRAARQRIPNRVWKDDDGAEHVEVNFYIRGPHGAGKVFAEMFKDQVDRQWKFVYLQVEINSPSPSRLLLESYLPA